MKYYVVSDVHGFYTELKQALEDNGFFSDKAPHKLIVCGDMLDRGEEAVEMQNFMYDLKLKGDLIYIRGNHEDLLVDLTENLSHYYADLIWGISHHISNGTWSTALQLSNYTESDALKNKMDFIDKLKNSIFYKELLPSSLDYYETENYIFVHGWIPCTMKNEVYKFNSNWRNAKKNAWEKARWLNGMALAELYDIVEKGKRIVCGHWRSSYGHCNFENKGSEYGFDADFSPFYGKNIIAIDGCTARTRKVNCLVIED